MKKIVSLFLIFTLLLTMSVGCNKNKNNPPKSILVRYTIKNSLKFLNHKKDTILK